MSEIKFCIGACCEFGRKRFPGLSFAVVADDTGQPVEGSLLPPDAAVRPVDFEIPATFDVAAHEAAHAVVAILNGMEVERVEVGVLSQMTPGKCGNLTNGGLIKVFLAGPAAQGKANRHEYRMRDVEILDFVCAVRADRGGGCDLCRVARVLAPLDDAAAIATWRMLEGDTLDLIKLPAVWRAIRNIAACLIERSIISGDEVCNAMTAAGVVLDAKHQGKEHA